VLSGRGLCDELITRPEESYRLCCVVCDLETSRIGAPYIYIYIYDISNLRVKYEFVANNHMRCNESTQCMLSYTYITHSDVIVWLVLSGSFKDRNFSLKP
jgi:hypothetical protein